MTDWEGLVPEPRWESLLETEQVHALGHGHDFARARAYFMLAEALFRRTKPEEQDAAIYSYVAAHQLRPLAAAYINLGVVLRQSGRIEAARAALNKALTHTPSVPEIHHNLATLPGTPPDEAIYLLRKAIALAPAQGGSYTSLAGLLRARGDERAARAAHEAALRLAPAGGGNAMQFGDWRQWWLMLHEKRRQLRSGDAPAVGIRYSVSLQFPFSHLELRAMAESHMAAASSALAAIPAPAPAAVTWPTELRGGVLRVAYIGALSDEPQLNAMSAIFSRGSSTADYTFFALTPPPAGEPHYYRHLLSSLRADALQRAHDAMPQQLAARIRGERGEAPGVDAGSHILLDGSWLKECTPHGTAPPLTRLNCALHLRAAPVRFSVLAAPVTNGLPGYTLADAVTVRVPAGAAGFSERLVLLPHGSYPFAHAAWAPPLTRDDEERHSRAAEGLGRECAVFASFVQRWKLNPITWPAWTNAMRRAPRTCLWLLQHSSDGEAFALSTLLRGELAATGLRAAATARAGSNSGARLVVMRRLPLEQHVRRTGLADLVLDTHPYSAHTTAADAFWLRGPPWLSLTGERFDSRLSGSVLHHAALGDLRSHSLRAFEDMGARLVVVGHGSGLTRVKSYR